MPKIKSASEIAAKWARVTPGRSTDYQDGVKAPKEDWAQKTSAAEGAYEGGVRDAINRKAFGKGVKEAGTEKWQSKTLKVIGRWGEGVTIAGPDYERGFAPFASVIERTELPPRYRAGDPRNMDRADKMASALHEAKVK